MARQSSTRSHLPLVRLTRRWLLMLLTLGAFTCPVALRTVDRSASASPAFQGELIHDIQGSGARSPFAGQAVSTLGVVTGRKSNGFFIQSQDHDIDNDPNTSQGVFIFTSNAPPSTVVFGSLVIVAGTVVEFVPSSDPASLSLTGIAATSIQVLLTAGIAPIPLPTPITLTAAHTNPGGPIDQLERFEGMRVRVESLTAVSPTLGSVDERNASATSNGVFYGVITGIARPFREPGIQITDTLPTGSPCCIPRFDTNPERLRIESGALPGSSVLDVPAGTVISNLTGPLDYAFRSYTILPDGSEPPILSGDIRATPVPAAAFEECTVASFNMQRFFDAVDDPAVSDVVLAPEDYNKRLSKASLAIRNVLRYPDIIGVQEVENIETLSALANRINLDARVAGEANPNYMPLLMEGNDTSGIDVGILFKSPRVTIISPLQAGKDATYTDPNTGLQETLNDRPPLVVRVIVRSLVEFELPMTIIVNHLRSLSGIDDPTNGNRVRAKRRAQAEFLANLIQVRQSADPDERIVSIGDYNSFQFNDGYVDVMGTIKGAPAPFNQVLVPSDDLLTRDLFDLVETAPDLERYSVVSDGNAQTLDHILVTTNMLARVSAVRFARCNADFPETLRNDAARPERISDHDIPVAYFKLLPPGTDLAATKTVAPATVRSGSQVAYTITIHNSASSSATQVLVTDILAFGTRFLSVESSQGSCTPPAVGGVSPVRCQLGTMGPGSTATITLAAEVTLIAQFPRSLSNNVLATAQIAGQIHQANAIAAVTVLPTPAILNASLNGKKLIVNGLNFETGAKIEINGIAQKTVADNQVPNLMLIAPKGRKKIARGETVTLTVLNPTAGRSQPFQFTRPT
jgi:uncharacterized protein